MTDSAVSEARPPAEGACPVCGGAAAFLEPAPNWGEWRCCQQCSHEFAHPLELPTSEVAMFSAAYAGGETRNEMGDFAGRVEQRELLVKDPTLWFWTPAFGDVLDWLDATLEPGATVLEIGCGLGFFLHAMRNRGYDAVGLDVAEKVVELNRADGFQVWHGTLDTMPEGWVRPDAVVAFFMLHHVVDPVGLLAGIHDRWPDVPLAVAQYGRAHTVTGRAPGRTFPPRTLHRWNRQDLTAALEQAGYAAEVRDLPSTGVESDALSAVRSWQKRLVRVPALYRLGKRIRVRVLPRLLKSAQKPEYTLLAFARSR